MSDDITIKFKGPQTDINALLQAIEETTGSFILRATSDGRNTIRITVRPVYPDTIMSDDNETEADES